MGTITGSGARSIKVDDINNFTGYNPGNGEMVSKAGYYPTKKTSNGVSPSGSTTITRLSNSINYYGHEYETAMDNKIYNMLFKNEKDSSYISYWSASRYYQDLLESSYLVVRVQGSITLPDGLLGTKEEHGYVGGISLFYNHALKLNTFKFNNVQFGVRPIVYLKSNLQTSGKNSSGAWTIIDK